MSDYKKLTFDSYNALNRPAMFWGIPIMPMIGLLTLGLLSAGIAATLLPWWWGVVFAFPFAAALTALRFITSIDNRFLRRLWFMARRLRRNWKYGRQLLLTPVNPNWNKFYGKRFARQRYAARGKSTSAGLSGT
jgi:uncharacterized protein (DUF58 family)